MPNRGCSPAVSVLIKEFHTMFCFVWRTYFFQFTDPGLSHFLAVYSENGKLSCGEIIKRVVCVCGVFFVGWLFTSTGSNLFLQLWILPSGKVSLVKIGPTLLYWHCSVRVQQIKNKINVISVRHNGYFTYIHKLLCDIIRDPDQCLFQVCHGNNNIYSWERRFHDRLTYTMLKKKHC